MSVLGAGLAVDELVEARDEMRQHLTTLRAAPREPEQSVEERGRALLERAQAARDPRGVDFAEYLVRLAMEAHDRVHADVGMDGGPPLYRVRLEDAFRERMAQAATAYVLELEVAAAGARSEVP